MRRYTLEKKFITSSLRFLLLLFWSIFCAVEHVSLRLFFFDIQRTNEWMKEWTKTKKKHDKLHTHWMRGAKPRNNPVCKSFGCPNKPNTPRRTKRARREAEKSSAFIKQVWIWCVKWMWEIDSCQVQLMPLKVFLCESENSSTTTTMRERKKGQKKTKTIPLSGMLTNFSGSGNTFASLNCTASNLI